MKTNHVLIDFENVHVKSLAMLTGEHFRVKVFLGPKNTKLPVDLVLAMQAFGNRAEYIVLDSHGANALDFHIAYYLGALAANEPDGYFHVISKDTGFDPLIRHLKSRKIHCWRSGSIEDMPCFAHAKPSAASSEDKAQEKVNKADGGEIDEMIKTAVDDLIKRKQSKPRTVKTLYSTIHAKLGKNVPGAVVQTVLEALQERGHIKTDGTKVSYSLPSS